MDPVFGLVVSGLILYQGARLLRSAGDQLLGRAPSETLVSRITEIAGSEGAVRRVDDVAVHDYGLHKAISLTIKVEPGLSVTEAHDIATSVEARIKRAMRADAIVHVEPAGRDGKG